MHLGNKRQTWCTFSYRSVYSPCVNARAVCQKKNKFALRVLKSDGTSFLSRFTYLLVLCVPVCLGRKVNALIRDATPQQCPPIVQFITLSQRVK